MKIFKFFVFGVFLLCSVLSAESSSVLLKTNVNDAYVYVDNSLKGKTSADGTIFLPAIENGMRLFKISKDGYKTYVEKFEISDISGTIRISLTRLSKSEIRPSAKFSDSLKGGKVLLYINANVADCDVFLDGRLMGKTLRDGSLILNVPQGIYTFEMRKKGFKPVKTTLKIEDMGKNLKINLKRLSVETWSGDPLIIGLVSLMGLMIVVTVLIVYKFKTSEKSGTVLGKFRLLETLGKGGMAVVYKAFDSERGHEVALKLMDTGLLNDKDLVEKFTREGEATSLINKNNVDSPVVKVFDYGKIGSRPAIPYISMEILKGNSLLQIIKEKKQIPAKRALYIVQRIAAALSAAHKNKIIHRDVTPDNIIVIKSRGKDDVRLIDFGVAKHEYTSYKTLDGSIAGKPPYMSPEQCRGRKVDEKSDIYSLGIILFILIEGETPYRGSNPLEIMKMHESAPVPEFSVSVDPAVTSLKNSMLSKESSVRPGADDVINAIQSLL